MRLLFLEYTNQVRLIGGKKYIKYLESKNLTYRHCNKDQIKLNIIEIW
jgi:hypothetical protein